MRYEELIREFVDNFPEIKKAAEEEIQYWLPEELPVYVFLGEVVNPFIRQEVDSMQNLQLLDRIFEFLESMAACDDERVGNALAVGILETIGDNKKVLENARNLMRPMTRALSDEVESSLGRLK